MTEAVCIDTAQIPAQTTTISHLPDELLAHIFSYLLPPPLRPSQYDVTSHANADLVALCSVSRRFCGVAEPLRWRILELEQHIPQDCKSCAISVERTCRKHTENGSVTNLSLMARWPDFAARHVRELRFGAFGYGRVLTSVLRAYRAPTVQAFLEKTYSAEIVEFVRTLYEASETFIRDNSLPNGSFQLAQVLALCLAPNLRAVHFAIEEPTQGILKLFLSFLESASLHHLQQQGHGRENVEEVKRKETKSAEDDEDKASKKPWLLRRPLGKVQSLRIWSCWENRDAHHPVIALLLRLPELSDVCTIGVDLDSHAGGTVIALTQSLRSLDLQDTSVTLNSLSSLLLRSPDLERLAISFDSSLEEPMDMAGLGKILGRCKNLRQLDLDFSHTCWVDNTRGDIIGGFREVLPNLEKLRMPLVQLIGDKEAVGDIAGVLPSELRWLWTVVMRRSSRQLEDGGLMHVKALKRFFEDVSERMPHLEGVVVDIPDKLLDLSMSSPGFEAEKDGNSRILFRRVTAPDQSDFLRRAEIPTYWRDIWLDREALQRARQEGEDLITAQLPAM